MKHYTDLTKQGKARRVHAILKNEYIDNDKIYRLWNEYQDERTEQKLDEIRSWFKQSFTSNDEHITNTYNL